MQIDSTTPVSVIKPDNSAESIQNRINRSNVVVSKEKFELPAESSDKSKTGLLRQDSTANKGGRFALPKDTPYEGKPIPIHKTGTYLPINPKGQGFKVNQPNQGFTLSKGIPIDPAANQPQQDEKLLKSCHQLEGALYNIMLKEMRKTINKSDLLPDSQHEQEIFTEMMDQNVADKMGDEDHSQTGMAGLMFMQLTGRRAYQTAAAQHAGALAHSDSKNVNANKTEDAKSEKSSNR
jgi:Rod binding domain-containing protein